MKKIIEVEKNLKKKDLPDIRPGDLIRVKEKIKEGGKERIQQFEGIVITKKKAKTLGGKILVYNKILGIGVEKIFPLHSKNFDFEILQRHKVRRSKLFYFVKSGGKKKLKKIA